MTTAQMPRHMYHDMEIAAAMPLFAEVDPHNPTHVLDLTDSILERVDSYVLSTCETDEQTHELVVPANIAYASQVIREARRKYLEQEPPTAKAAYDIVTFHARFNLRNVLTVDWLRDMEQHLTQTF